MKIYISENDFSIVLDVEYKEHLRLCEYKFLHRDLPPDTIMVRYDEDYYYEPLDTAKIQMTKCMPRPDYIYPQKIYGAPDDEGVWRVGRSCKLSDQAKKQIQKSLSKRYNKNLTYQAWSFVLFSFILTCLCSRIYHLTNVQIADKWFFHLMAGMVSMTMVWVINFITDKGLYERKL